MRIHPFFRASFLLVCLLPGCNSTQIEKPNTVETESISLAGSSSAYALAIDSIAASDGLNGVMTSTGSINGYKLICGSAEFDGTFFLGELELDPDCEGITVKKIGYFGFALEGNDDAPKELTEAEAQLALTSEEWQEVSASLPSSDISFTSNDPKLATYVVQLITDISADEIDVRRNGMTKITAIPNKHAIAINGITPQEGNLSVYPMAKPLYFLYRNSPKINTLLTNMNAINTEPHFIWLIRE